MPETELFLLFIRPFNRAAIRYLIGGSVAATFYGEPRLTNDVDFVIFLRHTDLARLLEIFPSPGFYVPPVEIIAEQMARPAGGHFNVIHEDTGFKADFYLAGRDELNAWGFRNSRKMEYRGEPIIVAPPEYVIIRKLEYFRAGGSDKHLRDIKAMLAVSGEQLDHPALHDWIKLRGLEAEWRQASA